jgi:hypothetical protein
MRQLLHGHGVTGTEQCAAEECDSHLTATRDAHILRARGDPSGGRQHRRDRLPQSLVSLGASVSEQSIPCGADCPPVCAADQIKRREPHVWTVRGKEQPAALIVIGHLPGRRSGEIERNPRRHTMPLHRLFAETTRLWIGKRAGDERTACRLRLDPPLGRELVKRGHDGQPLYAERPR